MSTPVAAQDICPTQADLRSGLALISPDPSASLLFGMDDFGVSVRPYNPDVYYTNFDGYPEFLVVNSPHAIIPGIYYGQKGPNTIGFYGEEFESEEDGDFDSLFETNARFGQVLSNMSVGGSQRFDVTVDYGTWKMMGLALWNRVDGVLNVEYLGPAAAPHMLGQCSYDIVTYRLRLRAARDIPLFEERHYAPALGLVVGTTPLATDGTAENTQWFSDVVRYDFAPGTRCAWEAKQGRDC